jgi:transcriptional regulator with XRE-family HTH domain
MKKGDVQNIRMLGAAIRERRRFLNMTQQELAKRTGLNRSHLSLIEGGEHYPNRSTFSSLAQALNTTPDWLIWQSEILSGMVMEANRNIYPGLKRLLNDSKAMALYNVTEEEKRLLLSIRLQWNNPSEQFFIDALLNYRLSQKEGD